MCIYGYIYVYISPLPPPPPLGSILVHHMNHFGLGQGYELVID